MCPSFCRSHRPLSHNILPQTVRNYSQLHGRTQYSFNPIKAAFSLTHGNRFLRSDAKNNFGNDLWKAKVFSLVLSSFRGSLTVGHLISIAKWSISLSGITTAVCVNSLAQLWVCWPWGNQLFLFPAPVFTMGKCVLFRVGNEHHFGQMMQAEDYLKAQ